MSNDGSKCSWCGLVFDYQTRKAALLLKDTSEYLCKDCAEELEFEREE